MPDRTKCVKPTQTSCSVNTTAIASINRLQSYYFNNVKWIQIVLTTISLLFVAACSQKESTERNSIEVVSESEQSLAKEIYTHAVQTKDLAFDSFSEFPEEIDGCSCYFSRSAKEFEGQKYIYTNDFANTSFVKVNGELRKLELRKHEEGPISYYIYSDSEYELRVEIKSRQPIEDELDWVTGEMTLNDLKNHKTVKTEYVGECGC